MLGKCIVRPNVVIADGTTLGDNVVVGPNSFVGASPFDYSISSSGKKIRSDRFRSRNLTVLRSAQML